VRRALALLGAFACFAVGAASLHAQEPTDVLAPALERYNDLELDDAATRFRSLLALTGIARLSDDDRSRAWMYLGATELFRGLRPAAVDAFRQLLIGDPTYRPDADVFPPEVVALFQETRTGVRSVRVAVPPASELELPNDRWPIRLFASSVHDIRVGISTGLGAPERVLYDGVIGDSLLISWDGTTATGAAGASSRYLLRVASRNPRGLNEREVQLALSVERLQPDTLPWPAPLASSALRPETEVRANGVRQFLTGLVGGGVAVVLPAVLGSVDPSSGRYAVAGAIGLAGVFGVATASKPQPIPENIAFNQARRAEWQREVDRVRAENAARRAVVRLRIRAERPVTIEIR
jgi:hypothetical protein